MVNLAAVRFLDEFKRTSLSECASALCFYRLRLALPSPCKGRATSPAGAVRRPPREPTRVARAVDREEDRSRIELDQARKSRRRSRFRQRG